MQSPRIDKKSKEKTVASAMAFFVVQPLFIIGLLVLTLR